MTERWTRRELLAYSAFGAATAGLAPRSSSAQEEPAAPKPSGSPNEAITLGFIGVGGMGSGLLNIFKEFPDVRVAAVCDVYEPHVRRAKEAAGGKPETYGDFRKVLDRKDIDAVVIATPDHWHAIPTIMACQAGKDVYCEKPLSHRVAEGRAVADAAAKYKRVTQMGNLIHATENYHRVVEIVRSGALGKITKTRAWMAASRESMGRPADASPPPGCDYDFWLGPAPERPFNSNRFTFNWRWFWDYGGGILTDFCCHLIDLVHWSMEVDAPRTICATGGRYASNDNAETPDTLEVSYEYQKGDDHFVLAWSQTDASDHGFDGKPSGVMFQGTEATLVTNYTHHEIFPVKGKTIAEVPKTLPRSVGHHREWLDAIRTRATCSCNFEYGHRLTTVGELGNISLWTGEKLAWDPAAERITNHVEANQFLTKEYRKPWVLPTV
ncbi:Gfo/Idh/MocA family protein [Paludisphaera rhizosphaerae]|uniref:Gfo/Idh/MocA family protein n=1 Tax=Paludisphaera rhizosphaerae TaxID=2711216 RepID=UPI0013ECA437|nr:Gfo/Idh/MocA family oxidoreductase [Paludisphaera rhizosphaerae]